MCFDCLQRRVEADYSGELSFVYGLSDSPLPFGSSAVVQVLFVQISYEIHFFFCEISTLIDFFFFFGFW